MKTQVRLYGQYLGEAVNGTSFRPVKTFIKFKDPKSLDTSNPLVQKVFAVKDFKKIKISSLNKVIKLMSEEEILEGSLELKVLDYHRIGRKMNLAFGIEILK